MATRTYLGRAKPTAQVNKLTVGGTVEADDVFIITINTKSLSVIAGSTDPDTVRNSIVTAFNAATDAEFEELTAAAHADVGALTLTADTPGVPFVATASTTEGNGGAADAQTFTTLTTTSSTGPWNFDDENNWSGGAVPVDGDDVVFSGQYPTPCRYGINQATIELASLTIKGGYLSNGGEIGLPATNEDGSYAEYRDQYLTLASDSVTIGQGGVDATSRIRLDLGGVDSTIVIYDTADDDVPTCLIKSSAGVSSSDGTPSSTTIEILGGEVGLGIYEDDDFEIDTLQVTGTAEVWVGGDVTLDSATISGGVTQIHCTPSGTLKINDGEVHAFGGVANAAGVLDINGGRCYYYSTIQPNSVNVEGTNSTRGVLDLSRDVSSRTMPLTIGAGGEVFDPYLTRSGAVTANGSIVAG